MAIINTCKPQIEIYPNKMMLDFLKKGLVKAEDRQSAFVFCSSYQDRLDNLKENYSWANALFFKFQDSESESNPEPFTDAMAGEMVDFLKANTYTTIYLCSDAGVSRSAAIAAALYKYYGYDDGLIWDSPHMQPNILVYSKVRFALGFKMVSVMDSMYKKRNESALERAIQNGTNINRNLYRYGINSKVSWEKKKAYFAELTRLDNNLIEGELTQTEESLPDGNYTLDLFKEVALNSLEFLWMMKCRKDE